MFPPPKLFSSLPLRPLVIVACLVSSLASRLCLSPAAVFSYSGIRWRFVRVSFLSLGVQTNFVGLLAKGWGGTSRNSFSPRVLDRSSFWFPRTLFFPPAHLPGRSLSLLGTSHFAKGLPGPPLDTCPLKETIFFALSFL